MTNILDSLIRIELELQVEIEHLVKLRRDAIEETRKLTIQINSLEGDRASLNRGIDVIQKRGRR